MQKEPARSIPQLLMLALSFPCQASLPEPESSDPNLLVNETVLWSYVPLLHPLGVARGLHSLGDPSRMRRVVAKMLRGGPWAVAELGASLPPQPAG